ncbi:hypothetical protein ACN5YO_004552 [Vibrio parahaemolyticus]
MDSKLILLELYKDEWNTCRNHQSLRASMTTMFVAIHSALLALIVGVTETGFNLEYAFLGVVISLFGAFFSKKHHEKFCYHLDRARGYRDDLDSMLSEVSLKSIKDQAEQKTLSKFPCMNLINLNTLWNMVHVLALLAYLVILWRYFT